MSTLLDELRVEAYGDKATHVGSLCSRAIARIKELEAEVAECHSEIIDTNANVIATEAQAATMREALEDEWLVEQVDGRFYCHNCKIVSWTKDRHNLSHISDCPLHSEAGKPMLAVLDAAEWFIQCNDNPNIKGVEVAIAALREALAKRERMAFLSAAYRREKLNRQESKDND